ncbi:MAG: hypothetical protein HFI31_14890 [Lachnospiraceae bacterium]|nr:hypothetical protein [Lachnospiraceae bacterium]
MNLYEQWLQKADDIGLNVAENVPFESQAKGLLCGDCIGLNQSLETTAEKACVLAEEVIHSQINVGNIRDQRVSGNSWQERKTRKVLHKHLVNVRTIAYLLKSGCENSNEIADKMGITEELLLEAIKGYKEEYGVFIQLEDDILFFEPTLYLQSQLID